MRCPFCGHIEDKVVDSRESREGDAIRRRRECLMCGRRFTSYERLEEVPILIVKKDGRREPFDRQKLLRGIMSACQKRPVPLAKLEEAAGDIQVKLMELPDREVASRHLGELVMDALKGLDSVAYVRFASVYRDFKDLPDFVKALEGLMGAPAPLQTPRPAPPAPRPPVILTKPVPAEPTPAEPIPAEPVPAELVPAEPKPARVAAPKADPSHSGEAQPFKSTPLFPGVAPERPGPPKRRKSR
jgi:transcriptional repressor NrdR